MAAREENHPATIDVAQPAVPRALMPADDYPSHISFNPPAIILSSRLYLRRASLNDLPAIHKFLSDEDTMKFMSSPLSKNLADTERWYKLRFVKDPVTGEGGADFIYMICLRDGDGEGEPIGTTGSRKSPHLGYQIGAGTRFWGKGYGSEAARAIVNGICKTIQEEKQKDWDKAYIRVEVESENIGSIRVAEKAGFTKVSERTEESGKLIYEFRVYVKDWEVV